MARGAWLQCSPTGNTGNFWRQPKSGPGAGAQLGPAKFAPVPAGERDHCRIRRGAPGSLSKARRFTLADFPSLKRSKNLNLFYRSPIDVMVGSGPFVHWMATYGAVELSSALGALLENRVNRPALMAGE
jgi:hypothetical protein